MGAKITSFQRRRVAHQRLWAGYPVYASQMTRRLVARANGDAELHEVEVQAFRRYGESYLRRRYVASLRHQKWMRRGLTFTATALLATAPHY